MDKTNNSHTDNTLCYKRTVFASTGTIQVQGNDHEKSIHKDFPLLLRCVKTISQDPQLMPVSVHETNNNDINDQTFVIVVETIENMPPVTEVGQANISNSKNDNNPQCAVNEAFEHDVIEAISKIQSQCLEGIKTYFEKLEELHKQDYEKFTNKVTAAITKSEHE